MKESSTTRVKAATLALACATALVAVTAVQARSTPTAGGRAAAAPSKCKIVVTGAPWRIRAHVAGGSIAGVKYTLAGEGMSCGSAHAWVSKLTKQPDTGQIKGPLGFTCHSFSTAASGDKLLYAGACMHGPHNIPFFEWAPKVS